jgi:hypothetical protein
MDGDEALVGANLAQQLRAGRAELPRSVHDLRCWHVAKGGSGRRLCCLVLCDSAAAVPAHTGHRNKAMKALRTRTNAAHAQRPFSVHAAPACAMQRLARGRRSVAVAASLTEVQAVFSEYPILASAALGSVTVAAAVALGSALKPKPASQATSAKQAFEALAAEVGRSATPISQPCASWPCSRCPNVTMNGLRELGRACPRAGGHFSG